jgi:hypothetical protein
MPMSAQFKTRAEQKLEWLSSLDRPLTERESIEVERAMHAIYVRDWRSRRLSEQRKEELETLERVLDEAKMPEWYRDERA